MYAAPELVLRGNVRTVTFGGKTAQTNENNAIKPVSANTATESKISSQESNTAGALAVTGTETNPN